MFEDIASKIQRNVNIDNIKSFERALDLKRESYVRLLQKDMKALFDGLEVDVETFFQLRAMISRNKLAIIKRLANSTAKTYVDDRGIKFSDKLDLKASKELYGSFKWRHNFTSFQSIKWCNARIFPHNSFMPKENFTFVGETVHVRHAPDKTSRHQKHYYLFDLLDTNNNVRSSVPFELGYDIFTAPTAIYSYGSRLLLVTSFYKILTNLIFSMLKKLDVNGEMPEKKPNGNYNACYFALFDANLKLVKEFVMCEDLRVGSYTIVVDFINDQGVMISKVFKQTYNQATQSLQHCFKRVVSFYDYNFQPVFTDFTLPRSSGFSNVVKLEGNLIHYAGYDSIEKNKITCITFDVESESEVSRRLVPRCSSQFSTSLPVKLLLDSKNNLYMISRHHFGNFGLGGMHEYYLSCVNLDTHELQDIYPPSGFVFFRGCYLNDNDQLVIVSKPDQDRTLIFNTFAV